MQAYLLFVFLLVITIFALSEALTPQELENIKKLAVELKKWQEKNSANPDPKTAAIVKAMQDKIAGYGF